MNKKILAFFLCTMFVGNIEAFSGPKKPSKPKPKSPKTTAKQTTSAVKKQIEKTPETVKSVVDTAKQGVQGVVNWSLDEIRAKVQDIINKLPDVTLLDSIRANINSDNPYKTTVAYTRDESTLCSGESQFLDKRKPMAQEALVNFLGMDLGEKKLNIAFCSSGGGYRAMICTLGFLRGAQEIGLLDCVTYISALSGSTWMLANWISSGKTLTDFSANLLSKVKDVAELKIGDKEILQVYPKPFKTMSARDFARSIKYAIVPKILFGQNISFIDFYGAILAMNLLSDYPNSQMVHLSDQVNKIKSGSLPFPIYTAVDAADDNNLKWTAFTPFEVAYSNVGVPTWSFGRRFKNGISIDFAPEQSMGYFMGIWGSAFEVNMRFMLKYTFGKDYFDYSLEDMINDVKKALVNALCNKLDLAKDIISETKQLNVDLLRTTLSEIDLTNIFENLVLGAMKNVSSESIDVKNLLTPALHTASTGVAKTEFGNIRPIPAKLASIIDSIKNWLGIDAGLDFNLPIFPLLHKSRKIDVIFIFDNSTSIENAHELKLAEDFCRKQGLKFPKINYEGIDKRAMSIFVDKDDSAVPMVIYMPRINEENKYKYNGQIFNPEKCIKEGYCGSFKFHYPKNNFEELSGLTYFNMTQNKDKIIQALRDALSRK
ncbi:MAG: hypothetical protein UR26_C0003G0087 [candidate division TM6 bacterium GW2011_GWF2_32_72]|nr:MAG: hypothetical protein UR26_C0003G0087 [candidate division TM6 bacterium GW2011_GWF2_32_72]